MGTMDKLEERIAAEIRGNRLPGLAVRIGRNGEVLYQNCFGYADVEQKVPVAQDTIYRFMSMTKSVIAAGILFLVEEGKLSLDDRLETYYPVFGKTEAADPSLMQLPAEGIEELARKNGRLSFEDVDRIPLVRPILIRDLLSHSSGLGMGPLGMAISNQSVQSGDTLDDRIAKWGNTLCCDTQPGEFAMYSPMVAFDILGGIIQKASDMPLDEFLGQKLFGPLEMKDTCFFLNEEQKTRLAKLYECKDGKMTDVTGTSVDVTIFATPGYCSGGGGLYSTVVDYGNFAQMLAGNGLYQGQQILKKETVELMHTQAQPKEILTYMPGAEWGLGVLIWKDPGIMRKGTTAGTYGWSGGFGTHFFVDPSTGLEGVVAQNISNVEGVGQFTPLNMEIEKAAFEAFS